MAWEVSKMVPVPTSLHMFSPHQLLKMSRSMVTRPPVIDTEPSARCAAILLHQSVLAVLPAVEPGVKQQVTCMHSAAAVGNSFVIDLNTHGIRNARDFAFLHGYASKRHLHSTQHHWLIECGRFPVTCFDVRSCLHAASTAQRQLNEQAWNAGPMLLC